MSSLCCSVLHLRLHWRLFISAADIMIGQTCSSYSLLWYVVITRHYHQCVVIKVPPVMPVIVNSLKLSHVASWKTVWLFTFTLLKVISTHNLLFISIIYHYYYCLVSIHYIINYAVVDRRSITTWVLSKLHVKLNKNCLVLLNIIF